MMWSTEFIIEDTGYSEDCLTLNVWAKCDDVKEKPVLVFIHGGGFTSGGSSCEVYDGESVTKQDVVFVTINYRVGILGYLAHPELSEEAAGVSGNYGLLDQIKALEWVRDNIDKFGGNPNNVTIMGQSAGAASVNNLIISPKAEGLFNKAVSMSYNSVVSDLPTLEEKEEEGSQVFVGKTLSEMRKMSTEELLTLEYSSSPCIDNAVIIGNYKDIVVSGKANDVTLLSGFVTGDTMLFGLISPGVNGNITKASFEKQVHEKLGDYAKLCLNIYPVTEENVAEVAQQLMIDDMIAQQNILARIRGSATDKDTYLYYFTHIMPGPDSNIHGAFHTADVPYFLNVFSDKRKEYWQDNDYTLGKTLLGYLVDFVKNADPNGDTLPKWNVSEGDYAYQVLDTECQEDSLPKEKQEFFNAYYGY